MGDPKNIIHELLKGLEFARQLQLHLHVPSPSSQETRDLLIHNIISTFENALHILNWKASIVEPSQPPPGLPIPMSESPPFSGSPRSEDSDRDHEPNNAPKKRSSLPRWTKQIRVTPGMGVEGPLDDGYSWRKYGQKDILGAMYPRGYYRCTHRNVQGCLATKQVQRSDEDPTVFQITYRGKHTCTLSSNVLPTSTPLLESQHIPQIQPNQLLSNLRSGLTIQTDNLDSPNKPQFPSFNFPSTSNVKIDNRVLPASPVIENYGSASYVSPATSVSPSGVHTFDLGNSSGGSQITEIMVPTAASAVNSPTVGLEFPFDQFEFDGHNFTFHNPRFFS